MDLPPPMHTCKPCPNGFSVIAISTMKGGVFNADELGFIKDRILRVKNLLLQGIRRESFAHQISWMNGDSLADLSNIEICDKCPAGTYFDGTETDYVKFISIPKSMTAIIKPGMLSMWKLSDLRCTPCEEGFIRENTADPTRCTACGEFEFAEYTEQALKIRSHPVYRSTTTMLPTRCSSCPGGTERKFEKAMCSSIAISSLTIASHGVGFNIPTLNDCCWPCEVNYFSTGNRGPCTPVPDLRATRYPYATTESVTCQEGEEMKDCKAVKQTTNPSFNEKFDLCRSSAREASDELDWRTCVACTGVEKPAKVQGTWTCQMCNGYDSSADDPGDIVVEGEYYNSSAAGCQECDSCSVFTPNITWKSVALSDEYTGAMDVWMKFGFFIQNRWFTRDFDVSRPCTPLVRRGLEWSTTDTISVEGRDEKKTRSPTSSAWKGQMYESGTVPVDHAIDYEFRSQGAFDCTMKHCRAHCVATYFYSQGCGGRFPVSEMWAQTTNADKTRTSKNLQVLGVELANKRDELAYWRLKHHGECVTCEICAAGEFNAGCNVWGVPHPKGSCESCLSSCSPGEFLWHEGGLRGCTPLQKELVGRVTSNYKCRKCPTWVQNNSGIYAVLGCGNKQEFAYHKYGGEGLESETFTRERVHTSFASDDTTAIATVYKPFFHLEPYCPARYFFDMRTPQCRFTQERGFKLHRENHDFGYEEYDLGCCTLCRDCDASTYRMSSQWLECKGASTEDTQGDRCVSSCSSEFWIERQPGTGSPGACSACSEC